MSKVIVKHATLRNGTIVEGLVAELVRAPYSTYEKVDGKLFRLIATIDTTQSNYSRKASRVSILLDSASDVQAYEGDYPTSEGSAPVIEETDEEILVRIREKFAMLGLLARAACSGKIRSMIVSGSPGTGKTHEVMTAIDQETARNSGFYSSVIKGSISPIALYIELWRASGGGVLVLDDSDSAFEDNEALQLLKAATESSSRRIISYRKMSQILEAEGIPTQFSFKGVVIILTNTNLEDARKGKQVHYEALMSRAHYVNAVLNTDREKILRIQSVIEDSDILDGLLPKEQHSDIVDFIKKYHNRARELSIRTVVKLAELRAAFPKDWAGLARTTLLK